MFHFKKLIFEVHTTLRMRKVYVMSLSHATTFPVSSIDFYEDGLCRTDHTLDIFPFLCTWFKNEEALCCFVILRNRTFGLAQPLFRLVGPLNRDLNYLRRIDSVWVYLGLHACYFELPLIGSRSSSSLSSLLFIHG